MSRSSTSYSLYTSDRAGNYRFAAGLDAFDQRITKAAKDVGIEGFQWLTDGKVGATWDAHRILWLAGQKSDADASSEAYKPDLQMKASARLYRDYHALSKDLSDRSYLAAAATELGLFESQEEAKKWLESDEGEYELGQGIAVARMNGIDSIPQVVIQVSSTCSPASCQATRLQALVHSLFTGWKRSLVRSWHS